MDTQIWYAVYYTIIGGTYGAFSHLGEVCDYLTLIFIFLFLNEKWFKISKKGEKLSLQ